MKRFSWFVASTLGLFVASPLAAAELFTFDTGPYQTPAPFDITVGSETAHFSAPSGYSIQQMGYLPLDPNVFHGWFLEPSNLDSLVLNVSFSRPLTSITIDFATVDYATDVQGSVLVNAYKGTSLVGTNWQRASYPGDVPTYYPSGHLTFQSTVPFDNVSFQYDLSHRATGDFAALFLADNMNVTPAAVPEPATTTMMLIGFWQLARRRRRQRSEAP